MAFLPKNKYAFEKGHNTWNKGIPRTEELKQKLSSDPREKLFKGKKHTLEARQKISLANKGRKVSKESTKKMVETRKRNGSYIPWNKSNSRIVSDNIRIRESSEYKLWRKSVFERDNYTCVWCNAKSGNGKTVILNADHIKPFAYYPELRFAIDNGRTLCVDCHRTTDTFAGRTRWNSIVTLA